MSTLSLSLRSRLARTVQVTERWKRRPNLPPLAGPLARAADFVVRAAFHLYRNHRYLTLPKLANAALVNLQFALKTERVWGRPYRLKIEATNICNTHCRLCPTGMGLAGRPKGQMSLERFRGLVDELAWHLHTLDLSMWGDPLIVPDIYDMIRYAHGKRVWTYLSSNLHAFRPEKGQDQRLVESGLDLLTCSLHGASRETFALYQPGKDFDATVAKVRRLVQTRDRLGWATPAVQLNFVVTRHNEHEVAAFTKLAEDLGCKAVFSWAALNVRFLGRDDQGADLRLAPEMLERKLQEHLREWLPVGDRYVLGAYRVLAAGRYDAQGCNGHKLYNCSWPWQATVINWDGTVVACCGSWDQSEDLGNLLEEPLGRIWNNPRYRLARRSFRRPVTAEQGRNNPCAKCPGFML